MMKFTKQQVTDQVKEILKKKSNVDDESLFPESVFHIDMELDSLEIAEVFFYVEDHFAVTFKSYDEEKVNNLQQLIDLVITYLAKENEMVES